MSHANHDLLPQAHALLSQAPSVSPLADSFSSRLIDQVTGTTSDQVTQQQAVRPSCDQSNFRDVIATCLAQHEAGAAADEAWAHALSCSDLLSMATQEFDQLVKDAPTQFMAGYVLAALSLRDTPSQEAIYTPACESHTAKLMQCKQTYPLWFEQLDQTDPDNATRQQVARLLSTAPTQLLQGLIYGKHVLRTAMSCVKPY